MLTRSRWVRTPSPLSVVDGLGTMAEWVDLGVFGALVVATSPPQLRGIVKGWAPWCVIGVRHGGDAVAGMPNAVLAYSESVLELEELVEGWLA